MEVRQLNTLIRAAQFQSFSKAAESLGYSQSAVTVQIKALEEELGVRLFDRMGKRVILTAQGQCFLEYANSILDTIHNARRPDPDDDYSGVRNPAPVVASSDDGEKRCAGGGCARMRAAEKE